MSNLSMYSDSKINLNSYFGLKDIQSNFQNHFSCKYHSVCNPCLISLNLPCCYYYREYLGPKNCYLPKICPISSFCPDLNIFKIKELENQLNNCIFDSKSLDLHQNSLSLDFFIPRVEIATDSKIQSVIGIINEIGIKTINVTPKNLFKTGEKFGLKKKYCIDLHKKLRYDEQILLSLNCPDNLCIKMMDNLETTFDAFKLLNPDIITFFDANFYYTQPPHVIKSMLVKCYQASYKLSELGIPIIPLYYPILPNYNQYQFQIFNTSKTKFIAAPFYEINLYKKDLQIIHSTLTELKRFKHRSKVDILCLNSAPKKKPSRLGDYYSSQTYRCFSKKMSKNEREQTEYYKMYKYSTLSNKKNKKIEHYIR